MFIQYLSEQAHNVVRSEKKPRRNIQYRDLGMLSLDFLLTNISISQANVSAVSPIFYPGCTLRTVM